MKTLISLQLGYSSSITDLTLPPHLGQPGTPWSARIDVVSTKDLGYSSSTTDFSWQRFSYAKELLMVRCKWYCNIYLFIYFIYDHW